MSGEWSGVPGVPWCSVIVPCWNDGELLRETVPGLTRLRGVDEVIVADASQSDDCGAFVGECGAKFVRCACPSRGAQLNAGARMAQGSLLVFHHADSCLTQAHVDALHGVLRTDVAVVGGAFHRKFDDRHARLRFLEKVARVLAARGGTLYGDQSLFVRRDVFERLGGFADIPLMEDIEFSRRLRRFGRTVVLDPPISTSQRHHASRGAIRTSIRNGVMIGLYHLGFPPSRLHAWYYRKPIHRRAALR